jgi:hypothetical protein
VPPRTDNQRSTQAYALRKAGFAFARPVVGRRILGMLVERGKLRSRDDRPPTELEVDEALTAFLFELADENNFSRVQTIMRERWHSADEPMECRR